jgi:two-component system, LuxR family, sensor kinase FixL
MRADTVRSDLDFAGAMRAADEVLSDRLPRSVWIAAALACAGYYFGTKLGFALTFQPQSVSTLWPPNAILLAALISVAPRYWWLILVAVAPPHFLGQIQSSVPFNQVLAWFASNCGEALIGAAAIWYLRRAPLKLATLKDLGLFLLYGALLAPFLSSFIDIGLVKLIGWGEGAFWPLWQTRFCSNVLASVLIVPLILAWKTPIAWPRSRMHVAEAVFVILCVLAVSTAVFKHNVLPAAEAVRLFILLPFLLWAAVRLGLHGTSVVLMIVAISSIWAVIHGQGPFVTASASDSAWLVQLFLIVLALPLTLLAVAMGERSDSERALRSSEARFAKAFAASPDAMCILRFKDSSIVDVNDRWQQLFGFSRAEATGSTGRALGIVEDERAAQAQAQVLASLAEDREVRDLPLDLRSRSGKLLQVLLTLDKTHIEGQLCLIVVIRDVTEQRRMEREAEEQRRHMTHLTRAAVLGQLSGALAHELNQPLTAILCNAQAAQRFLAQGAIDQTELVEILKDIVADDKRAGEVIRRLRALLGGQGLVKLEPVDVNELLRETLALVRGELIARRIAVHTNLNDALPTVQADRVQLQQVLLNLIVNATEAMDTPRCVERMLHVRSELIADGQIRIAITDSGGGIAASLLDRMFDPFFTTKEQGMGLGLSISRTIVNAIGGELRASNNESGLGASMIIMLPCRKGVEDELESAVRV